MLACRDALHGPVVFKSRADLLADLPEKLRLDCRLNPDAPAPLELFCYVPYRGFTIVVYRRFSARGSHVAACVADYDRKVFETTTYSDLGVLPAYVDAAAPGYAEKLKNVCARLDDELQVDEPPLDLAYLPLAEVGAEAIKGAEQAVSTWRAHVLFLSERIDVLLDNGGMEIE